MKAGHPGQSRIFIAGTYAVDLIFAASRIPVSGETIQATSFTRGHGGKASNQAVAAARAGAQVEFFTLLGDDVFADEARSFWQREGIHSLARVVRGRSTAASAILLDQDSGQNAIMVYPGACLEMSAADLDQVEDSIARAQVFVAQLEQPVEVALRGLQLARMHGLTTILNPAPACALPEEIFPLCDYILPNESEAALLSGRTVRQAGDAQAAARALLERGAHHVIVTLGEGGSLYCSRDKCFTVPACTVGPCIDSTGAGDAYTGGFATAIARGATARQAMLFATALAGISVTRPGAALSMPTVAEIERVLARQ